MTRDYRGAPTWRQSGFATPAQKTGSLALRGAGHQAGPGLRPSRRTGWSRRQMIRSASDKPPGAEPVNEIHHGLRPSFSGSSLLLLRDPRRQRNETWPSPNIDKISCLIPPTPCRLCPAFGPFSRSPTWRQLHPSGGAARALCVLYAARLRSDMTAPTRSPGSKPMSAPRLFHRDRLRRALTPAGARDAAMDRGGSRRPASRASPRRVLRGETSVTIATTPEFRQRWLRPRLPRLLARDTGSLGLASDTAATARLGSADLAVCFAPRAGHRGRSPWPRGGNSPFCSPDLASRAPAMPGPFLRRTDARTRARGIRVPRLGGLLTPSSRNRAPRHAASPSRSRPRPGLRGFRCDTRPAARRGVRVVRTLPRAGRPRAGSLVEPLRGDRDVRLALSRPWCLGSPTARDRPDPRLARHHQPCPRTPPLFRAPRPTLLRVGFQPTLLPDHARTGPPDQGRPPPQVTPYGPGTSPPRHRPHFAVSAPD